MFKILFAVALSSTFTFAENCDDLYETRGESLQITLNAFDCFDKTVAINKLENSRRLNKMAYLKFFEASYFENNSIKSLIKSFSLAKDSIKLFGPLFRATHLKDLPADQVDQVALGYYFYGTSVSKYIDVLGSKWEAVKRMSEIKNTMKMIKALKKNSTFHYGAHRTLAIFNLKVPGIAGGSLAESKKEFELLMSKSIIPEINISSYPVGHIFYSEYLKRVGKKEEACSQLNLVKSITDEEIEMFFKELSYETKKDIEIAKDKFMDYSC